MKYFTHFLFVGNGGVQKYWNRACKGGVANDSKLLTLLYSNLQSCQNTNKHMGVISPNDVMLLHIEKM